MYLTMNTLGMCLWSISILMSWIMSQAMYEAIPENKRGTTSRWGVLCCIVVILGVYLIFCQSPKFH